MSEVVILVEYHEGRPFSAVTRDKCGRTHHYDMEFSKRDGLLRSESSGSIYLEHPDHDFWTSDDSIEGLLRSNKRPATGKRLPEPLTPLEEILSADETTVSYCQVCNDFYREPDGDWACDHVYWCGKCAWWGGEGHEDGCRCRDSNHE